MTAGHACLSYCSCSMFCFSKAQSWSCTTIWANLPPTNSGRHKPAMLCHPFLTASPATCDMSVGTTYPLINNRFFLSAHDLWQQLPNKPLANLQAACQTVRSYQQTYISARFSSIPRTVHTMETVSRTKFSGDILIDFRCGTRACEKTCNRHLLLQQDHKDAPARWQSGDKTGSGEGEPSETVLTGSGKQRELISEIRG